MKNGIDIWCEMLLYAAITPLIFWSALVIVPPKRKVCHLRLIKCASI